MATWPLLISLCILSRDKGEADKPYVPPTEPRSEAAYGKLHSEIREAEKLAAKYADQLYPEPFLDNSRNETEPGH